jgi:hypothetical protein
MLYLMTVFFLIFPLPDVWLQWLEDEQQAASSREEKDEVLKLYAKAVKDYRCAPSTSHLRALKYSIFRRQKTTTIYLLKWIR